MKFSLSKFLWCFVLSIMLAGCNQEDLDNKDAQIKSLQAELNATQLKLNQSNKELEEFRIKVSNLELISSKLNECNQHLDYISSLQFKQDEYRARIKELHEQIDYAGPGEIFKLHKKLKNLQKEYDDWKSLNNIK